MAKTEFQNPSDVQQQLGVQQLRAAALNRAGRFDSEVENKPALRSGADMYAPKSKQESKLELNVDATRAKRAFSIEKSNDIRVQQHRKKKLIAMCEPVLNVNYDWLTMNDYPENMALAVAKRNRDYWLLLCLIFFLVFLAGTYDFVKPWLAGTCFGLFFVVLSMALGPVRRIFFKSPTLGELIATRKVQEFRALNHIKLLEGSEGLAWKCEKLGKYNSNIRKKIFKGTFELSRNKELFKVIRERKHIRLYLLLMVESEKAYKRLQEDYLKEHFKNLDKGFDDNTAAEQDN